MRIRVSFTTLGVFVLAIVFGASSQDLPRQENPPISTPSDSTPPAPDSAYTTPIFTYQDPDHQINAIRTTENLDKSESQMQRSTLSEQNSTEQALQKLDQQISSDRVSWSSTGAFIWGWIVVAILAILAGIAWITSRPYARPPDTHSARLPVPEVRRAA